MNSQLDESARQRVLDTYRVVDSLPEAAFDDISRLASLLCGAPIALVSLIDRDRQWFKASTGFEARETRREDAFCNHAILTPDELMLVPDAGSDLRFAQNPLVTGALGIRFYAGVPLVTPGGAAIGTVCVLDREPRSLDESQRAGLASLARLTMNLLEARHRERELERVVMLGAPRPASHATTNPAVAKSERCTIAIVEVQDHAAAAIRDGERTVERALAKLESAIETATRRDAGDSVCRSTGSPEIIVMLHGDDVTVPLQALAAQVADFERASGLRALTAAAASEPAEPIESVFLRADALLSAEKDRFCAKLSRN